MRGPVLLLDLPIRDSFPHASFRFSSLRHAVLGRPEFIDPLSLPRQLGDVYSVETEHIIVDAGRLV